MAQLMRTCTFVYIREVPSHVRYPPKFSSTRQLRRESFLARLAIGFSYHCARGSAINHIRISSRPIGNLLPNVRQIQVRVAISHRAAFLTKLEA